MKLKIILIISLIACIVLMLFNWNKENNLDGLSDLLSKYKKEIRVKDSLINISLNKISIDSIKIDSLNSVKSKILIKYKDRIIYVNSLTDTQCMALLPDPCEAVKLIIAGERDSMLLINCNEHLQIKDSMYFEALTLYGLEKDKNQILNNEVDTLELIAQSQLKDIKHYQKQNKTLRTTLIIETILSIILILH